MASGKASRGYRIGQIGSASLVSLAHGTNDAQKTMGVITLALVAHGSLPKEDFEASTRCSRSSGARRPRVRLMMRA
jgi:phosphate/sulfate permease